MVWSDYLYYYLFMQMANAKRRREETERKEGKESKRGIATVRLLILLPADREKTNWMIKEKYTKKPGDYSQTTDTHKNI